MDYSSLMNRNMDTQRAIGALGALAQETRLQVFRVLVKAGPKGLAAGAIAEALGIPSPTLSFHLQQLNYSGLVTKRRESRSLIYSVSIEGMNMLMGFLMDDCCGGKPELCKPGRVNVARGSSAKTTGKAVRQNLRKRAY